MVDYVRSSWLAGAFILALAAAVPGLPAGAASQQHQHMQAVTDGHARFEVLTPTLIRMEYAGDNQFQDAGTFNVPNRNFPGAAYTTDVSGGYLEIHTASVTLRYKEGGGPFTSANTSVQLATGTTATPEFPSYCVYDTPCQAEDGMIGGSASNAYDHQNYTGSGFLAGLTSTGAGLTQDVSAIPSAGTYQLSVRYANSTGGDGQSTTRTLSTKVDGNPGPQLSLPVTGSWDTWSTASVPVTIGAGTHTISVQQTASDSGNVNLDSIAVTPTGASYPASTDPLLTTGYGAGPTDVLGGWDRSLDNPDVIPMPEHPGILDKDGWYLLDDTRTALTTGDRPSHGTSPYQDGYFFGYGQNYKQGLTDLNTLIGGTDLLPQSAYGVWYSRYYAYTTSDYENTLLPTFRSTFTPIDWLVIDTDWKSPSQWNGWNWNSALFPDPQSFMNWTKQQNLQVAMNIHPSIASNDPQFATANSQAGGNLTSEGNGNYDFDWSNPAQLNAYLNLHHPFEQQGVHEWWLDYCTGCGGSTATDQHVAPDNWINQAYAADDTARGLRGFSFARIGGEEAGGIHSNYPLGPWSERRNTMQFTGDTPNTWDMLAFEARFTPDEAAAGLSNVSDDIGSFHGNHLDDAMYARWVQLGTFQPVDRLHSDHGDRLPWNYTGDAQTAGERFLRLREALVPYTYTLAAQANATGIPITRPLYLDYPDQSAAYSNPEEYLYGDNVLVAPIVSASNSVTAWIPPGTWTDYFSGTTYTGPSSVTITDPITSMPVLIKSGGVMPTRTNYVDNDTQPLTQLTLNVAAGADGQFTMYQDGGEGPVTNTTNTPFTWQDASHTLTIGAASDPVANRAYTLRLSNSAAPTAVQVDGVQVPETAWGYNPNSRTVTVTTANLSTNANHTVTLLGSATGNPAAGEVVGPGGQCLSGNGGVGLAACDHSAAQTVTPPTSGGTVRIQGNCLTASGTAVQLASCSGATTQSWTLQANGELANSSTGQCLTGSTGTVNLAACTDAASQVWQFPPSTITNSTGLCADVANADPASGAAVQLWTCNGSDAQRWHAPGDGTLRTLGKCLDVTGGATANNTLVQLWDCNGTGSQTWVTQSNGSLLNPQSGRCLDDPNNNDQPGDHLQIYDCNNTTAQQYRLGT